MNLKWTERCLRGWRDANKTRCRNRSEAVRQLTYRSSHYGDSQWQGRQVGWYRCPAGSLNEARRKRQTMKKTKISGAPGKEGKGADSASRLIDARIKELGDWRGEMLARIRTVIRETDPEVVEEV